VVRLHVRRCAGDACGGILDRHEDWLDLGAVALRCGYDPLNLLGLEGEQRTVMIAILQRAADRLNEEERVRNRNMEAAVHNGVVSAFRRK
jgi:hypothetical protein